MRTRTARSATLALLSLTLVGFAGCSGQQSRLASYRQNPSPELDTLWERHDDIDNHLTITNDTNARQINQDIGRVLLLDRPSRMTKEPIPY